MYIHYNTVYGMYERIIRTICLYKCMQCIYAWDMERNPLFSSSPPSIPPPSLYLSVHISLTPNQYANGFIFIYTNMQCCLYFGHSLSTTNTIFNSKTPITYSYNNNNNNNNK